MSCSILQETDFMACVPRQAQGCKIDPSHFVNFVFWYDLVYWCMPAHAMLGLVRSMPASDWLRRSLWNETDSGTV